MECVDVHRRIMFLHSHPMVVEVSWRVSYKIKKKLCKKLHEMCRYAKRKMFITRGWSSPKFLLLGILWNVLIYKEKGYKPFMGGSGGNVPLEHFARNCMKSAYHERQNVYKLHPVWVGYRSKEAPKSILLGIAWNILIWIEKLVFITQCSWMGSG